MAKKPGFIILASLLSAAEAPQENLPKTPQARRKIFLDNQKIYQKGEKSLLFARTRCNLFLAEIPHDCPPFLGPKGKHPLVDKRPELASQWKEL
jgi:hypothetical protein